MAPSVRTSHQREGEKEEREAKKKAEEAKKPKPPVVPTKPVLSRHEDAARAWQERVDEKAAERKRQEAKEKAKKTVRTTGVKGLDPAQYRTRVPDKSTDPMGRNPKIPANVDILRTLFGMEAFQEAKFIVPIMEEGADGKKRIVGYEENPTMEGYRLGPQPTMGSFGTSASRMGMGLTGRQLSEITHMSITDALQFYESLSVNELASLQHQMKMAGLFAGKANPRLGFRDYDSGAAFAELIKQWAANPDMGIMDLMQTLQEGHKSELAMIEDKFGNTSGVGTASAMTKPVAITDATTLGDYVDKVSVELFGSVIDPERKAALVTKLQDQEKSKAQANADLTTTLSGGSRNDLDYFMDALIGQESGGDQNAVNGRTGAMGLGQILPDNWGPWAREAGVDPADFSEKNQRRVIRHKLNEYYKAYGNWRDVSIAWYSGYPSTEWSAGTLAKGQGPSGDEPSMNAYAEGVLGRMMAYQGEGATKTGDNTTSSQLTFVEDLADAKTRATAELKAMDPERYAGTQFAKQARAFFDLLGGVSFTAKKA